jgi:lipopolysaccharide heptosyltransferase I
MRVLVLRLSALGDVIHTIPAVVALRDAMPDAKLVWVVESPYRELVELVAGVEAIPVSMKKWGRSLIASRADIRRTLRTMRGADASIDFQGLIKSASLAWVAGAKQRYGFERRAIREKPASLFINRPIAVDTTKHVVEWNLELAAGVAQRSLAMPQVDFAPFADDPDAKLREFAGRIVFLPGAGRAEKLWPAQRFRELAQQLGNDNVVVAWGPGEKQLSEAIGAPLAPETNLRELAELLRTARVVIGADTGPLHLAAALGTPVIGLYGPTSSRRNGPWGQLAQCIDVFASSGSMEAITVDDVARAFVKIRSR